MLSLHGDVLAMIRTNKRRRQMKKFLDLNLLCGTYKNDLPAILMIGIPMVFIVSKLLPRY
jgi:hypothetical protein